MFPIWLLMSFSVTFALKSVEYINKRGYKYNTIELNCPIQLIAGSNETDYLWNPTRKIQIHNSTVNQGFFVYFNNLKLKCQYGSLLIYHWGHNKWIESEFCVGSNYDNNIYYEALNTTELYFSLRLKRKPKDMSISFDMLVIPTSSQPCLSNHFKLYNSCISEKYCTDMPLRYQNDLHCPVDTTELGLK